MACANGLTPCTGFDPNYMWRNCTTPRPAYTLSPDSQWQSVIAQESAALTPLTNVTTMTLNASNGSRRDIPSELFYTPIYEIFDSRNLPGANDGCRTAQQSAMSHMIALTAPQSDAGPNAFALAANARSD